MNQSNSELNRLVTLWGIGNDDLARMFGVDEGDVEAWRRGGVPVAHHAVLADLVVAAGALERHLRKGSVPVVVRRPIPEEGQSLLDVALGGEASRMRSMVLAMFDLRRTQP